MTITTSQGQQIWKIRHARKDVFVALVALAALLAGWILYRSVDTRVQTFAEDGAPFRLSYPAHWSQTESLAADTLMKVEDAETASAYKTNLTISRRDLDTASPPTLQTLLDRRVLERNTLTGYHFIGNRDLTVGGQRAVELNYAFVAQPIEQARREALPVVVRARDVIVVGKDRSYYLTLAAPAGEFEAASARFDTILQSARIE